MNNARKKVVESLVILLTYNSRRVNEDWQDKTKFTGRVMTRDRSREPPADEFASTAQLGPVR